jgi:hypothetical protein
LVELEELVGMAGMAAKVVVAVVQVVQVAWAALAPALACPGSQSHSGRLLKYRCCTELPNHLLGSSHKNWRLPTYSSSICLRLMLV